MDTFKLTILLQALNKNLTVVSKLDGIKHLTKLGDYIKKYKIKDEKILNTYINASNILLGAKNNG